MTNNFNETYVPDNDPVYNQIHNSALEWAAQWIEGSLDGKGLDVVVFANMMCESLRAAKREVGFQQIFFDAVRNDPYMEPEHKAYWLSLEEK